MYIRNAIINFSQEGENIMKKKLLVTVTTLALAMAVTACGGNKEEDKTTANDGVVTEANSEEETNTVSGNKITEYKSDNGWSVQYNESLISVIDQGDGSVQFAYTGEASGPNMITISYIEDKLPEEVLYEYTAEWADEDVIRNENYMPGTTDKWSYWRTYTTEANNLTYTDMAIAGEYNGGVLLFQLASCSEPDEEKGMTVSDAMAFVIDSITYDNYETQTMFEYYVGTYKGEAEDANPEVTLNEDHTGVLTMQDSVDIIWESTSIYSVDGTFLYDFTIEGDNLYLMDGEYTIELSRN